MTDIIGTSGQDVLDGTSGDDVIDGRGGDDFIYGKDGNDVLRGGSGGDVICDRFDILKFGPNGDDTMYGGSGDDQLVSLNGADQLYGNSGNDDLDVFREQFHNDDAITVSGGGGDDRLYLSSYNAGAHIILDGGPGNDFFELWGSEGMLHIDLGSGHDTVYLASRYADGVDASMTIKHFTPGASGNSMDLLNTFGEGGFIDGLPFWDGVTDPFAAGFMELVQKGHNVLFEADPNASGNFHVVAIFEHTNVADFTAENFSGFDPHPTDGLVT